MAVTIRKEIIDYKAYCNAVLIPVASGETILGGTLACVYKGYLYDLDSTSVQGARVVVIVADDTDNVDGPAATTSNGGLSGTFREATAVAGDKTVRKCYIHGEVELTFNSIAQTDLFKTVYATDNYTVDETKTAGVKIGSLSKYYSATKGAVLLNCYYNADGLIEYKTAVTADTGPTAGGAVSLANPTGATIMVENVILDVTTKTTGSPVTMDIGVAANGTTSSDTLIDGCDVATAAAVFTAIQDGGSSGQGYRKMTSTQYITATGSASLAGIVGTLTVLYRIWE